MKVFFNKCNKAKLSAAHPFVNFSSSFCQAIGRSTLLLSACFALMACSSSDSDSTNETRQVTVPFAAEASNLNIDCDTRLTGLGTATTDVDVLDFRFYIHALALRDAEGNRYAVSLTENIWQQDSIALVDFTNKADSCAGAAKDTHTEISGTVEVPEGTEFNSVEFVLGVPSSHNHEDRVTASSPLDIASMHWNWQNGYKHGRLDVAPVGGISRPTDVGYSASSWNIHLGSTDCVGDPELDETVTCGRINRPLIRLDNFDPAVDTVLLDYEALVAGNNLSQDEAAAPGCMSGATDPECAEVFAALGLDVSTGAADALLTQSVFRVQ